MQQDKVCSPTGDQRKGLVMTQKDDRVKGAHFLETTEEGTCQDMERRDRETGTHFLETARGRNLSGHWKKVTSNQYSLPGGCRGRDSSGYR